MQNFNKYFKAALLGSLIFYPKISSMLIKKCDADSKSNSKNCTVFEYYFANPNLGFATAKIDGIYPGEGQKAINTQCDMIYFVISGTGIIHHEKGDFEVAQGDAFLFTKGEWYWVESKSLFVSVITSPEWTLEQYKII